MPSSSRALTTRIAIFIVATLLTSGCLTTRASDTKREPLIVPPAPPRVVAPSPEPPQEDPVVEPEPVPPLPRVSRIRETPRPGTESKPMPPEASPAPGPTAAESAAPPPAATNATTPSPELRTVETPDDGKASQLVKDTITRAGRTLSGIDYRALPRPSQVQYDMAKRFIEQSEEALKSRNYTAAQLMAEKAATIAKELSGR